MKIADFSIKHPVIITILLIASILFGFIALSGLRQEMIPDVSLPKILVITTYPGVGPEDIEKEITNVLEDSISTISGIKSITSDSINSTSVIMVEFDWAVDLDMAFPLIREKINMVAADLPDGIQGIPALYKMGSENLPIFTVVVNSSMELTALSRTVEEKILPNIQRIDGVANVRLSGEQDQIVEINIKTSLLEVKKISLVELFRQLQYNNVSFPAGNIRFQGKDINLRTFGQYTTLEEIKNLVIGFEDNTYIRLQDVADISLNLQKPDNYTLKDDEKIMIINIYKQHGKDTIKIIDAVRTQLKSIEKDFNNVIKFQSLTDQGFDIALSISSVRDSAILGGLLAIAILFLFLRNIRATLIISISIPLSILFTFIGILVSGKSLNILTLGGITVGIGMIVDSSIVVLENIYKIFEKTKDKKIAASEGTQEVTGAIIASTLTSVAVFVPIMFSTGIAGLLLNDIALTVIISLSASLIVSIVVIPFLASLFLKENPPVKSDHIISKISDSIDRFIINIEEGYKKQLMFVLHNRPVVFFASLCIFLISFFAFNLLGFEFIPETDMNEIKIGVTTPTGYSLEQTKDKIEQIQKVIREFIPEIENMVFYAGYGSGIVDKGSNLGIGTVRLKNRGKRRRTIFEIVDVLRVEIPSKIPDVEINISNGGLGAMAAQASGGSGFKMEVFGNSIHEVYRTAVMIESILKEDMLTAKTEINVKFDRRELVFDLLLDYLGTLGVSPYEAAISTRILFNGMKAGVYRSNHGNYDIYLNSDLINDPLTSDILNRISIKSSSGEFISFANIAEIREELVPSVIPHKNKQKSIIVTAYLKKNDLRGIQNRVMPKIEQINKPIGVNYEISGEAKEMAGSFGSLLLALFISLFLVYMVMVIQFEKFTQPLIVMLSVPFTVIGVIIALLVFGSSFSIISFLGVIMLAGVVVNNAIVMIDYTNLLRTKYSKNLMDAVIEGGSSRLKPILMTTLTTILGIIPMAVGIGEGAEMYAPLGQAVAGGLITSTLITLFIVPAIYYSFEHKKIADKVHLHDD